MATMPLPSSPRSCSTATASDSLQNSVASLSNDPGTILHPSSHQVTPRKDTDNRPDVRSQWEPSTKSEEEYKRDNDDEGILNLATATNTLIADAADQRYLHEAAREQSPEPRKSAIRSPPLPTGRGSWLERQKSVSFDREANMPRERRHSSYSGRDGLGRHPSPGASPSDRRTQVEEIEPELESSADEHTAIIKRNGSNSRPGYGATSSHHLDDPGAPARAMEDDAIADVDPVPAGFFSSKRRRSSVTVRRKSGQDGSLMRSANRMPEPDAPDNGRDDNWFRRMLDKYGSIELENKGSVARDHLALERTFLAWLRTSLSFASIGIAITQLFRLNTTLEGGSDSDQTRKLIVELDVDKHMARHLETLRHIGKPLGATFIGVSILILLIGFHRYFESQHYVIRGKFPASRGSVALVSMVTGSLIITSLVIVVTVARQSGST